MEQNPGDLAQKALELLNPEKRKNFEEDCEKIGRGELDDFIDIEEVNIKKE